MDATKDSRYKKIVYDDEAIPRVFVESFLNSHETPPDRIILDLDTAGDPLHGPPRGGPVPIP
ncbi:MAG: hypothetical protein GY946_33040 [bacterium]|nr:hypothetical protein [bacterium]